jgi:ATP-dependent Zn protease
MIAKTRASLSAKPLLTTLILGCCLALAPGALSAAAASNIVYQDESYAQFQKQLAEGQIKSVTINKRLRSLRTQLDNGTYVLAKYQPKHETDAIAALRAKHVPVSVLSSSEALAEVKAKPVHHKIRYIVGGVVIVVLLVIVAVLFTRRRRAATADY